MEISANTSFTTDYVCSTCKSTIAVGTPYIEFTEYEHNPICKSCIESIIPLLKAETDNYETNLAAHKEKEAAIKEKVEAAKLQHNLQLTVIRSALKEKKIMTSKLSFSGFSRSDATYGYSNNYHSVSYYTDHGTKRIRTGPSVEINFSGDIVEVSAWVKLQEEDSTDFKEVKVNLNNPDAISQIGDAILNYNPLLPVRK